MSWAWLMNDAAWIELTFLPVCAFTSLMNAPSLAHASVAWFAATEPWIWATLAARLAPGPRPATAAARAVSWSVRL